MQYQARLSIPASPPFQFRLSDRHFRGPRRLGRIYLVAQGMRYPRKIQNRSVYLFLLREEKGKKK